jgi:tRNA wybutosine-synthesizing protein 1
MEFAGEWWTTFRVPLALIFAVALLVLTRRRQAGPFSQTSPEKLSRDIPSKPPPPSKPSSDTTVKTEAKPEPKHKPKKAPKRFTRAIPEQVPLTDTSTQKLHPEIHIFYASQFNHTSSLAKHLLTLVGEYTRLHDISVVPNLDDYFLQHPSNAFYILLLASYANDSGPTQKLVEALEETLNDFRVDANPLHKLSGFAVFGTGDKEGWPLKKEFCYQALKVENLMERLGAKRLFTMGMGDAKGRIPLESQLDGWAKRVLNVLTNPSEITPSELTETNHDEQEYIESDDDDDDDTQETPLLDVEDIGPVAKRHASPITSKDNLPKPMVSSTSTTHSALTKQGYTIVGTHSGVKICRWTKSALRGRGSCYKFSFYGIKSHLCMETTPSLACANKCVFCWRHGTNPVGTTWRWQVDPPEEVYRGALEGHYSKIKMLRGMMGVREERWEEAKRVRHCALSLVGEPIFCNITLPLAHLEIDGGLMLDPHINEFLGLLHRDHISSFLVTNAQHPSALRTLQKPTQLYVSIDASNKESLKAIDRPLFKDFWERTLECLDILRERQEELRTVYRFTLVKGFNMDEIFGYGGLIDRGRPWLIEIKGNLTPPRKRKS